MNAAVRGKSAPMPDTTSSTSAAPPPTRTVVPAGGASGPAPDRPQADESWDEHYRDERDAAFLYRALAAVA